jgi:MFS family permease
LRSKIHALGPHGTCPTRKGLLRWRARRGTKAGPTRQPQQTDLKGCAALHFRVRQFKPRQMRPSFPTALGAVTATYALGYSVITLVLPYLTAAMCHLDADGVVSDAAAHGGASGGGPGQATSRGGCAVGAGSYGVVMATYPIAKALVTPVLGSLAGVVVCTPVEGFGGSRLVMAWCWCRECGVPVGTPPPPPIPPPPPDAYGHRRVLVASMVVTGMCFWGMSTCGSMLCLVTLRFVTGIFAGIGAVLTSLIVDTAAAAAAAAATTSTSPASVQSRAGTHVCADYLLHNPYSAYALRAPLLSALFAPVPSQHPLWTLTLRHAVALLAGTTLLPRRPPWTPPCTAPRC